MSSTPNDNRANGRGLVGKGCVGHALSPGTSLLGTDRSSIGHSGVPVTRSNTYRNPILVACATTSIILPGCEGSRTVSKNTCGTQRPQSPQRNLGFPSFAVFAAFAFFVEHFLQHVLISRSRPSPSPSRSASHRRRDRRGCTGSRPAGAASTACRHRKCWCARAA